MIYRQFMLDVGSQEANLYLLADAARQAVLVDAGGYAPELVEWARCGGLRVTHLLLTHLHGDHVDGLAHYRRQWPALTVVASSPWAGAPGALIARAGDTICAGTLRLQMLQTSGHTPESVSYYEAASGLCFVGDAIFAGSVGGTASAADHAEQLEHLRRNILSLPEETVLLPGHGPLTTVAIERAANPFFQPGFARA
jgi:glyoxylase-like metal-dependent hydrolase (beta-lactamase superfamily II)